MTDQALSGLLVHAILDIRKDEMRKEDDEGNRDQGACKRVRDLPLHVSRELAMRLQAIAGTQRDVESLFYGYDDTGMTAAEGRKQRAYVSDRAMPMSRARHALGTLAWMAFLAGSDELLREIFSWEARLDAIEAARPILKGLGRRKISLTHGSAGKAAAKALARFRAQLEYAVAHEYRESQVNLAHFVEHDRLRLDRHMSQFGRSIGDLEQAVGLSFGTNLAH
ncbi:TPA: hypothetical protein QDC20_005987 [Burkholderia aenigmatica]|uniref:hypothetical protein n=1 Tax=Burkholderia sp. AU45251 TaxID=3059204 RepID=UPI0026539380|nr:hypothetical protein [Burkholderia sp. AU45251]HDR9482866.1 hypothetical protein [Burkholderia aenigmatica]MDN7520618.1 hypothetical protein [Burkholderia sp. AU45251]HDR9513813.1 hypothetical protein [Burkholderia aenigmatica]HDR9591204.1 hypothetical protein [Burkholderia aenigmatica]HDR9599186.1 hypothetical protein [Burkholderia aenigmatica]